MLKTYHVRERHGNKWHHVGGFNSENHDRANIRENLRRYASDNGLVGPFDAAWMRRRSVKPAAYLEIQCKTY